jgi:ABC-2 type transport system permease protein
MTQITAMRKLIWLQTKISLREPLGLFFTLLFAPLLLLMIGAIFGNDPVPEFGGQRHLDMRTPTYAAIVIGVVGLIGIPVETVGRREMGALRRFRATPLRPLTYIAADVFVNFVMVMLGILLLFLVARLVFQVQFSGNLFLLLAGICLSTLAFLALGYLLASLLPTASAATVVGNVLIIPMLFLSGITVPLELMPETVQNISRFIPLTCVATLLRGLWFGEPVSSYLFEVAILGGTLVVATMLAAWRFRWE